MASICFIRGKWRALIRRHGIKPTSKSFPTRTEAEKWARSVEHAADTGKAIGGLGPTIGALLRSYRALREDSARPIPATSNAHYMLVHLERFFGLTRIGQLTPREIVKFAQAKRSSGAGQYTVLMEVSQLSTALRYVCAIDGVTFPAGVFAEARKALDHLHLVGPARSRDRRATKAERARLLAHFDKLPTAIPMRLIYEFAEASAMRRGEICRILWADYDAKAGVILVRDRKDPRFKSGNNQRVPLRRAARDVLARVPRIDARIFPYAPGTITYWFRRACRELGIDDLRFHDGRHEATSAMFEAGMDIPEVALVTGHKKWDNLRRYTQLKPEAVAKRR